MYDYGTVSIGVASILNSLEGSILGRSLATRPPRSRGPFGGLIAGGWHTAAVPMRPLAENYLWAQVSLGGAGADEIRWPDPVRRGTRSVSGHGDGVQEIVEPPALACRRPAGR